METNPETEDPISHLDFTPTCSVGHPGGSETDPDGNDYDPCPSPARFFTDVHGHPQASIQLWCPHHLAIHTIWIKSFLENHKRSVCLTCGASIGNIEDLIFNLLIIDSPAQDD